MSFFCRYLKFTSSSRFGSSGCWISSVDFPGDEGDQARKNRSRLVRKLWISSEGRIDPLTLAGLTVGKLPGPVAAPAATRLTFFGVSCAHISSSRLLSTLLMFWFEKGSIDWGFGNILPPVPCLWLHFTDCCFFNLSNSDSAKKRHQHKSTIWSLWVPNVEIYRYVQILNSCDSCWSSVGNSCVPTDPPAETGKKSGSSWCDSVRILVDYFLLSTSSCVSLRVFCSVRFLVPLWKGFWKGFDN